MSFTDKMKNAVSFAKEKTGVAVDTGKMMLEVRRLQAQISTQKQQLADKVCTAYEQETLLKNPDTIALCDAIAQNKVALAELRKKIAAVKKSAGDQIKSIDWAGILGKKTEPQPRCPECGKLLKGSYVFCPACGAHIDADTVDDLVDTAEEMFTTEDTDDKPKTAEATTASSVLETVKTTVTDAAGKARDFVTEKVGPENMDKAHAFVAGAADKVSAAAQTAVEAAKPVTAAVADAAGKAYDSAKTRAAAVEAAVRDTAAGVKDSVFKVKVTRPEDQPEENDSNDDYEPAAPLDPIDDVEIHLEGGADDDNSIRFE